MLGKHLNSKELLLTLWNHDKKKRSDTRNRVAADQRHLPAKPVHRPPRDEVSWYLYHSRNCEIYENVAADLSNVLRHSEQSHPADDPIEEDRQGLHSHVGGAEQI